MFNSQSDVKSRVLIADDDEFCRAFVTMRVAALDTTVVEAEDGLAALTLLLEGPFDAAIIDLEMPKVDGFALLGCIRANPKLKHLPVIVLSGHGDQASINKAMAVGATSYLVKPLNWSEFGEHIRSVICPRVD